MSPSALAQLVKDVVRREGFERVGIAPAAPLQRGEYLRQWLETGLAGEMGYLHEHLEIRQDPSRILPGARSIIVAALNYHQPEAPKPEGPPRGRVAMYAWGDDYHKVIKRKLWRSIDALRQAISEPFEARAFVDTAPLLERELAAQAGVGWIGKNTLILHETLGSYALLGEIVTTLDLPPDQPAVDHCGSCTRCLDACPTQAFTAPYQMDATRCISYHTIELRGDIPAEFHAAIGEWVFGCDICQQVCPYNRKAPLTSEPAFAVRDPGPYPVLQELLNWQIADYRRTLTRSAIKRAKLPMLQRNARIALDNAGADPADTGTGPA